MIYRLIIQSAPGRVDTGASYPACDRDHPSACDPIQFASLQEAIDYARSKGEIPNVVNSAEEAWIFIDNLKPPAQSAVASVPMNPNDILKSWQTQGLLNPQATIPSLTPGPMTGAGLIPLDTGTGGTKIMQGEVYRLIMETAPGRVDTGASYPLCSRANSEACRPQQFASIADAVAFALANNEIPVQVASAEEAWAVIEGQKPVTDDMIIGGGGFFAGLSNLDPMTLGLIALGAVVVLPRLMKRR